MIKYFFILLMSFETTLNAQDVNKPVLLSHYVFDSFTAGTVKVKSGIKSNQKLNYNILTGEMIYDDGGKLLAIGNPEDVDTVSINGREFIPVNNKFYEVLSNTSNPLLLEFTFSIEEPGASVGYGNATPSTNATSLKTLIGTGSVYEVKLPDDFKVTPGYVYWIRTEGQLLKAGSVQQLIKIFPQKKSLIKELVKKNKTNFSNPMDVITVVTQIQQ